MLPQSVSVLALVALLTVNSAARAGDITINNLSNDGVFVCVFLTTTPGPDKQMAKVYGEYQPNDKRRLDFPGNDAWVRVLKGGQPLRYNFPKSKMLFCDAAPFQVWTTEDKNICI